jgi:ubiquinone/menaquinone biosynthesis C-methylase UbiE
MEKHVCPWWIGYILINPIRSLFQNPEKILSPYVMPGMTVLDIGSGMGFLTIPAARMVGEDGKVIAVDLQEKMLASLVKRAAKAGLEDRIVTKLCTPVNLGVSEPIDLCLAFYVLHEVPDVSDLLVQIRRILKPEGRILIAEPGNWHVSEKEFQEMIDLASAAGLELVGQPRIPGTRSALLSPLAASEK